MKRLIDVDVAIDRIRGTGYADQIKENVIMILMGLPSAQTERKTGEWINDEHDIPRCSNCGYMPEYNEHIDDYYYSDWCPNCGAKMEASENE